MKELTDRALSHLSPAPRASAIFAALARGDLNEADRLADTAPRAHYAGADFITLFEQSLMVATTAALHIERAHKRHMAARAVLAIMAYRQQEGGDALIFDAECQKDRHLAAGQAMWAAYGQAIKEAGLDPAETMRAVWSFDDTTQELLEGASEPDASALALYRGMLHLGTG
jgi:hypothetical protein